MANENFRVKNGLEVGGVLVVNSSGALVANISVGTTTVNATAIGVGSNITINTSAISVGNSTVNAVLTQNSLDIDGTITSGNLNVTGHIIPGANVTYDLGNTTMRWRDLYLSGTTIDVGGALLQTDANSGAIAIIPKPTIDEPNPTATVISPQGGVVAVPTTGGVPAANAVNEAATSNTAAPVPIDVLTTPPANSQILVWSASANVFLPTNTLLYLNALNSVTVGANLIANTSALFIGNSTVNAVLTANSLDIDGTVAVGNTTITGDLTVSGNVFFNGGTTNVNSTNLVVEDKNIILGDTTTPTDVTADGGGITLKGTTDKTLTWVDSTDAWTASEDFNLVSGKQYEINGTQVINSTSLGTGITGSSLTSVGTLNGLSVSGTANATTSINVGANVNLSTSAINVGNSTVNTTVTSSVVTTSNVVATNLSGNGASVTSVDAASVGGNTASTLRTYSETKAGDAYSNAIAYSGNAVQAYSNATAFAANADNIASGTLNTARLPATINVSTAVNVGADVNLTTATINVGNSTVNTTVNSSVVKTGTANLSTAINVGANVNINATTIFIGNSTVNTTIQAGNINLQGTQLTVGAVTIADNAYSIGNASINSTAIAVGANVITNTSALFIGNSTVNSVLTSTSLDVDGAINVGNATITGDLVVSGNVFFNGTTTNVNSTNLVVEDKNIIIGDVATPTDVTADGGGITLKGATDKTLNWVDATDAWTSSEDFNLLTGKQYEINGVQVVNSTALGSGVTGSSLTSVGTLTGLTVSGATSLQNTLAAGNTTVTGFVNVSSTANVGGNATLRGDVTVNGALTVANTAALGNTSVTGFVNASVSVNSALITVGTSLVGNTTGLYHTGTVNATSYTVGASLVGNSSGLYHTGTVNAASHTTTGVTANVTGVYPASNSSGTALGATANRWILNANTVDASGLATLSGGMNTTTANASVGMNVGANVNLTTTNINVGNSTVNTAITSGGIDTDGTLAVLGAATLSNTLAAGNTTVTGFINVSSTANVGGAVTARGDVTVNGALTVSNTAALGNTTITGWANLTGNIAANNISARGNLTIDGDLTVSGNSVTLNSINLKITDNMIFLNEPELVTITGASSNGTHFLYVANNGYTTAMTVTVTGVTPSGYNVTSAAITLANSTHFAVANTSSPGAYSSGGIAEGRSAANPDLGFTGEYDDGTVRHAGVFRDATDSYWKVFDSYTPEPNGSFIDTANNTFRIANFQANNVLAATANVIGVLAAGNTTVTGFVNASVSVNSALITVGTNLIGNTTGLYHTGTVDAASVTVGASLIGNSSGLYHTGTVNAASHTTTGVTANVTGVYPASNTTGTALGATANRWILNANTIDASGLATLSGALNTTTANASVGMNVGANVNLTTTNINVGNSTVNTAITSTAIDTDGTLAVLGAATVSNTLAAGNTTVTGFVNASVSVNSALITVGTSLIGNTTGLYHTGTVNAASVTVGASLVGNSSGLYHTGTVNAASHTTTGVTANVTGVYPASNSSGTALGAVANRWLLNANTINASGLITGTSGLDITGTANVSTAINVGANLTINTSTISIGNSTVNTFIQAGNIALRGTQLTIGNTTFDGDFLTVGNSTVNVFANSTTLKVGANVTANATALFIGNSTVNSVLTATSLDVDGVVSVGNTTITGDLVVSGNVFFNGTTTNVNSTNLVVEDKNIVIGDVTTPTDVTADGGGITLKGATDKTFNWTSAAAAWTSSEDINVAAGKQYEINGVQVVNSTALGTGITGSSLTSVGTLTGLTVSGAASLQNTLAAGNTTITGFVNASVSVNSALITVGTNFIANTSKVITPTDLVIRGGGATGEGGQIVIGYGNNLASSITGQSNYTWNMDVIGGNTGSTPLFRVFGQNGDGSTTAGFNIANTGRIHVGSLSEQTDSTFKVTGSANVTTTLQIGTSLIANGATGTADQILYANSTGGVYWRTPATITNVEPSTVGATSNGHVWYVYV